MRSVTKSLVSTALGLLIDDGLTTLDTLAVEYMPSLAADYPGVTLRHLTTMTSGYHSRGNWVDNPFTIEEPYFTPPGAHLHYSNTAMEVSAKVLTEIAGESLEDLFRQRIAQPIGMTEWIWPNRGLANPPAGPVLNYGAGSLRGSARDTARLGHLFLNRGQWNGEQLISTEWVDAATRAQVPGTILPPPWADVGIGPGVYGYNWWVNGINPESSSWLPGSPLLPGAPSGTYWAWGVGNHLIIVVPEWNMVVVRKGGWEEVSQTTPAIPTIPSTVWGEFLSQIDSALIPNVGPLTLTLVPGQAYLIKDNDGGFDDMGDATNDRSEELLGSIGETDFETNNAVNRLVANPCSF